MQAAAAPVAVHRPIAVEEAARADFYAVLARLLHAAPDGSLLAQLAAAPSLPADAAPALASAWRNLVDASSVMDADAAAEEYESLFVGVGKAVVSIYAGFYLGAPAVDHPRVRIRRELEGFGLSLKTRTEPEDHLAGLLDAMRVLIAGGAGRGPATLEEQRRFFDAYVRDAAPRFFTSVGSAPQANYYRNVAALGAAFMALEAESFLLD